MESLTLLVVSRRWAYNGEGLYPGGGTITRIFFFCLQVDRPITERAYKREGGGDF